MADRPVTGQVFVVLTAMADGPRHAFGIVREVERLQRGRVKPKIGGASVPGMRGEPRTCRTSARA
jgi:hypothetical protein